MRPSLALLLVLVLVPAACTPGSWLGGAPSSSSGGGTSKPVAVPKVLGRLQADAAARLRAAGLGVRVVRVRSLKAVGSVVSQRPTAGARVARGTWVSIAVSTGPGP